MNNDLIDKIERLPHSFNYDEFGHNSELGSQSRPPAASV